MPKIKESVIFYTKPIDPGLLKLQGPFASWVSLVFKLNFATQWKRTCILVTVFVENSQHLQWVPQLFERLEFFHVSKLKIMRTSTPLEI